MSDHQHMQASVSRFRSFPMTHQKDEQHVKNPVFSVHASRENSRIIPKDRFDEPKLKGNDKEENNTQLSRNTARNGQKEDLENIVAKTSIKNNEVLTSSSLESAAVDPREDTSLKLCVEESPDPTRSENVLETHIDDNSEIRLMSDFVTMSEHHSELELLNSSVLLGSSNHQIAETKALSTRGKSHCSYVPPSPIDTREDFVSVHKKETGNPTGKRTQPLSSIKSNIRIGSVDYLTMGESPVECLQHSKLAHIQGRRNDVTRVDPLSLSAYLMDNRVFLPENTIRGDSGNDQSSPTPMDTSALSTTETPITSPKQDEPIPKWLADIISAVGSSSPVNASKPDTPLHLNIHYDATVHNVTIPSTQYCAINNSSITASNEPPVAAASKIGSETKRDVTSVRGRKEPLPPEEAALILKHYHYLKNELDATAVVEHLCAEGIFDSDDKRDVLAPSSSKRKSHVLLQKLLNAGTGDAFDVFVEIVEEVQPCVSDKLNVASGVAGRTRSKKNCCVQ
ncbi:unnamed protein product [Lymnaea stagnalis]|uniref:CARD domain-containing protein n=1 Tax=Lymnaea stagnalis TaxID=6523 RepID=A0AAV2IL28_LYMST